MGQSQSSVCNKSGRQRSFRGFIRRNKLNKSSLSHTFSLPPPEEYPELMNINTATEEQLMTLPGVGRPLARAIVRHRQLIGRFKRVDDLALVSGIGAEKLELLRPEICTNMKKVLSRASSCTQSLESIRPNFESRVCSVNSASVFQLQCVPGLNQEIAANIVDYRNKKGPFKSLDDLIKVRGMDIVRLSTVKIHLSLEPRKCESVQALSESHVNDWSKTNASLNGSVMNHISSTPKVTHRKSLSMPSRLPITLPNGFATAPVNDIIDLLSAYSHRPVLDELFNYERNGERCCRVASWNLHNLSLEKINNPGVREVVCRTILENKLSIVAIQDVLDPAALKALVEELNAPALRRVREFRANSRRWESVRASIGCQTMGFIFDSYCCARIIIEDIDLEQLTLLASSSNLVVPLVQELNSPPAGDARIGVQAFLICNRPLVIISVQCESLNHDEKMWLELVSYLADTARVQLTVLGEMGNWQNVTALNTYQPLLDEGVQTTVDAGAMGRSCILSILPREKSNFNGISGVIRSGLSHLAIPRGWSWGGPASPHCPIWAELIVPD